MPLQALITTDLPDDVDPAARLRGVPLLAWSINNLARALPIADFAVLTTNPAAAAIADHHGVAILDAPPSSPCVAIPAARPFCSLQTLKAALASGAAPQPRSPIESLTITNAADLELLRAVAAGLPPDHPCVSGVTRLRLPLNTDIHALISDVDGVLTDGRIEIHSGGGTARAFAMQDGIGTRRLLNAGFEIGWLSASVDDGTIQKRADRLGVHHVDIGEGDKADRFIRLCARMQVDPANTLYIGDDHNDLPAIELAGLSACPANARPLVKSRVDLILDSSGGCGVHAELADLLLDGPHSASGRQPARSAIDAISRSARQSEGKLAP